jgi:hypothetical protein
LAALIAVAPLAADERRAPHFDAGPVDQLAIAGNACGPAALLAAIRCGDERWTAIAERLPGESDRAKMNYIIRAHGLVPSASLKDRRRWTREGVNADDLAAIASELAAIGGLPAPRTDTLFRGKRESPESLARRFHKRLTKSLARGFPPIVSVRRYVERDGRWTALQGHFITVVSVPRRLGWRESSFEFTYFDPWGGKTARGHLRVPGHPILGAGDRPGSLEAVMIDADIGRSKVRRGERSVIVPTVVTGTW